MDMQEEWELEKARLVTLTLEKGELEATVHSLRSDVEARTDEFLRIRDFTC